MEYSIFELIILIATIPMMCTGIFLVTRQIVQTVREKRKEALYKHCKNCGSRLSEWFKTGSGYMICYPCGTISEYMWHQPELHQEE